jgi:hypothetical protein
MSTSIQTSYRLYRPSIGQNKMKTASHWASVADFSEDKLSVSGDVINYTLDTEKREYKVKGSIDGEVTFDFTFAIVDEAITSKTYFSEERDNGYSGLRRE